MTGPFKMDLKTPFNKPVLYLFITLQLMINYSEAVTSSKCQKMMTTLSCYPSQDNSLIKTGLAGLTTQIGKMMLSLEKSKAKGLAVEDVLIDLQYMNASVENLTSAVHNMSYGTISEEFISEDNSRDGDETGRLHIALLCLWIELETLTRNVSVVSTIQKSGNLATNLKISDLKMQISYLQQHVLSTNDNMTILSERVQALESNLSLSSSSTMKEWSRKVASLNHSIHTEHIDKLDKLKSKISSKGKLDEKYAQSTLNSHINSIPEVYEDGGDKTLHELLGLMEDSNLRLLNLSLAVLRTEAELETLRNDFSRRLATLEEKSAAQRRKEALRPHTNKTATPSAITHDTCNGARRHLVGDSCYFMPLVIETDTGQTWWDSRYLCKGQDALGPGADLVSIESEEEMDNIIRLINNHFGGIEEFWIGGNDLETEGQWRWVMNSKAITENSYTNWGLEPYRSTQQNCMSMLRGFKWAAEPCFYQRHPICELNLHK